jgi:hypothetical protein
MHWIPALANFARILRQASEMSAAANRNFALPWMSMAQNDTKLLPVSDPAWPM